MYSACRTTTTAISLIYIALLAPVQLYANEITVNDDWQRNVSLDSPAKRIIALAPHLTELVYEAGAGERLVGVSDYSDYPPPALELPVVSDYRTFNHELIIQLNPDLILVWGLTLKQPIFQKFKSIAYNFYVSQPENFEQIARNFEDIAKLVGKLPEARMKANAFRLKLKSLSHPPQSERRTAYLLWLQPTLSINKKSWISKAIRLCGGINIFADLQPETVRLGREALLSAKPDYVLHSLGPDIEPDTIAKLFGAVGKIHYIEPDLVQRPSLRIIGGVEQICQIYHP